MGLMILMVTIFYLIALSFLVVARVAGTEIKILVALVDGPIILGGKLLAPTLPHYLASEPIEQSNGG
ncbi:MAG: hypothetical protein MIL41_01280 [Hyphomicrobiales bacterium]|jgi:hypothetical protein